MRSVKIKQMGTASEIMRLVTCICIRTSKNTIQLSRDQLMKKIQKL